MLIRRYAADDLPALLDVWYRAAQIAHDFLPEAFFDRERVAIAHDHMPNADAWVIEDGGVLVGFSALVGNEVGAIFVDPTRQGEGFGRALMDHAAARHETLELEVFEGNRVGRRFYDRYGFETVARSTHEPTGETMVRMRFRRPR
jgi:putative acetyltransferase